MSPAELESYLHEHIPLSKAMAVSVAEASVDSVTVSAPLEPNINHRATVFGEAPRQWAFWLPGHCCTCACVMPA